MKTFHHYDIAIRANRNEKFKIIDNPSYGWAADPFLVEFENTIYLFAEIFLYKSERNGVIGYRKINRNGELGEWTISMDKHWHLSYPNVYVENDKLLMVPESYQLEEVAEYELIAFPDKWKKKRTIIPNVEFCDSTFLEYKDGNKYMFTFERGAISPHGIGWLYKIENGMATERQYLSDSLEGTRCGGKLISNAGRYIRVGQNCTREYGGGLIFYEIDAVWPEYSEHEIKRIEIDDIDLDKEQINRKYTGVHTYNKLQNIEVIDLRYASSTDEENEASERVHRVFLNKYE